MNEKIRQLAVEAGINFYKKPVLNKDYPELYDGEYCESELEQQQKFAELIVRECLDIVNRKEYSYHEADPLWETSQLIKEHFGVEE